MTEPRNFEKRLPPAIERLYGIAHESAAAHNELLSPEYVTYVMAWRELVNPHHQPFTLRYGGMAADVATPLHATDADNIQSINFEEMRLEQLQACLHRWDKIDNTTAIIRDLHRRRDTGVWGRRIFEQHSLEVCLMVELKRLGVLPESIHMSQDGESVTLTFEWQYPGELVARSRRIMFTAADIRQAQNPNQANSEKMFVDCYYEKAIERSSMQVAVTALKDIGDHQVRPGGYMLLGPISVADEKKVRQEQRKLSIEKFWEVMGDNFEPIQVPRQYIELMVRYDKTRPGKRVVNLDEYGWYCIGARKKKMKV